MRSMLRDFTDCPSDGLGTEAGIDVVGIARDDEFGRAVGLRRDNTLGSHCYVLTGVWPAKEWNSERDWSSTPPGL